MATPDIGADNERGRVRDPLVGVVRGGRDARRHAGAIAVAAVEDHSVEQDDVLNQPVRLDVGDQLKTQSWRGFRATVKII
jgi:hypothetical protein